MRKILAGSAALARLFGATDAHALELGTPASQHPYRSAQNFAAELRFSPYYPQVDDEPGLKGQPFKASFGDKPRLAVGLEFDWQVLRIPYVGTIGPGLGINYVSMTRPATTVTGQPSGDEYGLKIYPFYLSAVLRVDSFWREAGFPIVPYAKAGLGYALWRATTTGGTSEAGGVSGKGHTWGTQMAIGVAFALDVLDRGATVNMDNAIGINNTYIYAEYYWLALNGLGQPNALHVGTNTWAAGLAFEF